MNVLEWRPLPSPAPLRTSNLSSSAGSHLTCEFDLLLVVTICRISVQGNKEGEEIETVQCPSLAHSAPCPNQAPARGTALLRSDLG